MALLVVVLAASPFMFSALTKKPKLNQQYFKQKWQEVYDLLNTGEGKMLAVIEADKLLDKALVDLKVKGVTMGERMVAAQAKFSDKDHAWRAHKLRNKMVHEPGFRPKPNQIKDALVGFRQGLKDLGAL
jgi:hypothetical protein